MASAIKAPTESSRTQEPSGKMEVKAKTSKSKEDAKQESPFEHVKFGEHILTGNPITWTHMI